MTHRAHSAIVKRLNRADGHLHQTIAMIEQGRSCFEFVQQLEALENAINNGKKAPIHDHIEHCLTRSMNASGSRGKAALDACGTITKYL